jgi:uncharacterized membrane protein YgcG
MKNGKQQPTRPRAQRFGGAAKTAVSIAAVATMIGGWNLVAHLDNAQADEADASAAPTPAQVSIALDAAQPTQIAFPTLAPLVIAPVPTLRAAPGVLQPVERVAGDGMPTLSDLSVLAPLPTLAPLPAMPELPPPPPAPSRSSNGGSQSSNGGGQSSNSGGQTSSGGS